MAQVYLPTRFDRPQKSKPAFVERKNSYDHMRRDSDQYLVKECMAALDDQWLEKQAAKYATKTEKPEEKLMRENYCDDFDASRCMFRPPKAGYFTKPRLDELTRMSEN